MGLCIGKAKKLPKYERINEYCNEHEGANREWLTTTFDRAMDGLMLGTVVLGEDHESPWARLVALDLMRCGFVETLFLELDDAGFGSTEQREVCLAGDMFVANDVSLVNLYDCAEQETVEIVYMDTATSVNITKDRESEISMKERDKVMIAKIGGARTIEGRSKKGKWCLVIVGQNHLLRFRKKFMKLGHGLFLECADPPKL